MLEFKEYYWSDNSVWSFAYALVRDMAFGIVALGVLATIGHFRAKRAEFHIEEWPRLKKLLFLSILAPALFVSAIIRFWPIAVISISGVVLCANAAHELSSMLSPRWLPMRDTESILMIVVFFVFMMSLAFALDIAIKIRRNLGEPRIEKPFGGLVLRVLGVFYSRKELSRRFAPMQTDYYIEYCETLKAVEDKRRIGEDDIDLRLNAALIPLKFYWSIASALVEANPLIRFISSIINSFRFPPP